MNNKEFIILNVYTPYESLQNEYLNRLAFINYFNSDNPSTSVYVVGDMNAHLSDQGSLFASVTCVVFISCGLDRDTQHWMQRVLLPAQWVSK